MKFFRIDLLTLLISLFILNSCKNQDTAGFTLGTKGTLTGSLIDTATVYTKTTTDDSVVTSGIPKCPLGVINDPIFGTTQSDLITDLNLPGSTAYTVPSGTITIDSAVLFLKYTQGFYGDSSSTNTSAYTLNVYQLSKRLATGATYYNNTPWPHESTILGSKTFSPRPNTKVINDTVKTGFTKVLDTVAPEIRVRINSDFVRSILFNASSSQLNSNLIFQNNVKGFYLTVNKNNPSDIGNTMMVRGTDSLLVYIRATNGTVVDTLVVPLPTIQHASYVHTVRSTAFQNAITNKTSVTDSLGYLQGLAGSRVKVSFPYLQKLFSTVGGSNNVIINRAELVVTAIPGTDIPAYLAPLPRITMYQLDIAHQRIQLTDAVGAITSSEVGAFGGFYNKPTRTYHFIVTSYLQNLIANRTADYGTYIAPIDTTNTTSVDINPSAQVAARTVIGGGYVNASPAKNTPYSMRLNVIYTKIK